MVLLPWTPPMTGRGWLVFCRRARLPASSVFTMGLQPQLWRGRPPRADSSGAGRRGAGLRVTLSPGLQPVAEICYARIGQLFDLACDPRQVAGALGPLAEARPGLRLPGALDAFEQAVRAVLGQLVSVAMAARLTAKVAAGWENRWRRRPAMCYFRRQSAVPCRSAGAEGAGDAAATRGGADPPRPGGAQRRAAPDGAGGY